MTLYKYVTADRVDILRNGSIRFTPPSDLNDPHEMTPVFDGIAPDEEVSDLFEQNSKTMLDEKIRKSVPFLLRPLIRFAGKRYLSNDKETIKRNYNLLLKRFEKKFSREFPELLERSFRQHVGVLSLSSSPDNLLMWSHYASSHTGFVIAFDEEHSFFRKRRSESDEFNFLRPVTYTNEKPVQKLTKFDGTLLLLTKSKDWSYEQEWRMTCPLSDASSVIETELGSVHLFDFPPDAIAGVTIGTHASQELVEEIISIANSDQRYAHMWVNQAELQRDTFALKLSPLPLAATLTSIPDDAKVSVDGIDGDEGIQLGEAVAAVVRTVREQPLDFSLLLQVVVTTDIISTLGHVGIDVDETSNVTRKVVGFTGDELKISVFLSAEIVLPILSDDENNRLEAIHNIHFELGRVHNMKNRWEMFGGAALDGRDTGTRAYTMSIAEEMWSEFIASALSSGTASTAVIQRKINYLLQAIIEKKPEIDADIKNYRRTGDHQGIFEKVLINGKDVLLESDLLPNMSSFISRICSGYGPVWTGLQTPLA